MGAPKRLKNSALTYPGRNLFAVFGAVGESALPISPPRFVEHARAFPSQIELSDRDIRGTLASSNVVPQTTSRPALGGTASGLSIRCDHRQDREFAPMANARVGSLRL